MSLSKPAPHGLFALLILSLAWACAARQEPPSSVRGTDGPSAIVDAVPGELLVRVEVPEGLATEEWPRLLGRGDFSAAVVECLLQTCRVALTRKDGPVDLDWTSEIAVQLEAARLPGIRSVELNTLSQAR